MKKMFILAVLAVLFFSVSKAGAVGENFANTKPKPGTIDVAVHFDIFSHNWKLEKLGERRVVSAPFNAKISLEDIRIALQKSAPEFYWRCFKCLLVAFVGIIGGVLGVNIKERQVVIFSKVKLWPIFVFLFVLLSSLLFFGISKNDFVFNVFFVFLANTFVVATWYCYQIDRNNKEKPDKFWEVIIPVFMILWALLFAFMSLVALSSFSAKINGQIVNFYLAPFQSFLTGVFYLIVFGYAISVARKLNKKFCLK